MKKFLLNSTGIIITSILLTIIVFIESLRFIPWAPYFIIYALLAITIPLYLKTYQLQSFRETISKHSKTIIIILIIAIIYELAMDLIHSTFLTIYNAKGNPYYDFNAALNLLAQKAGEKFNITTNTAIAIYGIYIIIWAPIGEELFYRGYIYGELRKKYGETASLLISSFFFGIRHFTHFFFLTPTPIIPAIWWTIHAFFYGFIMVYSYKKTNSLYTPMLIHLITNLVSIAI